VVVTRSVAASRTTVSISLILLPRLHDTIGCQTGCITGLTTGCIVQLALRVTLERILSSHLRGHETFVADYDGEH